ncbi:hypothetical protein AMS68_001840 [Peltaster fructicola]|uniref:Uncharacterized protein n=1 Tax=Peltaster fructicola TaxID=286661 RepID=A0A6H0XNN0_9PEZI|nr:hypothetical protein AMS68_001840 [Peltaster fructicola]
MAAAITTCAQCAFGAISSSLLSFPLNIQTLSISIGQTVTFGNDSLPTTISQISTLSPLTTATTPPGAPPVTTITYTDVDQLTWVTFGKTLSFPTTYVDYQAFVGAAVTGAGCASTLAPTAVNIPGSVPTASLIYPLDRTGALPAALLSYLDTQPDFIGQLNGNKLETCASAGAIPATGTILSVTVTQTSTLPTTTTATTYIPPSTTITSTGSRTTTETVLTAASAAVTGTGTVGVLISVYNGPTVVISGSHTTSVVAQSEVQGGPSGKPASINFSSVLAALSSKASVISVMSSGVYTNSTVGATTTGSVVTVPASRTASASYTGAAAQPTILANSAWLSVLGSLGFIALL